MYVIISCMSDHITHIMSNVGLLDIGASPLGECMNALLSVDGSVG
jgi:hypothetical protein